MFAMAAARIAWPGRKEADTDLEDRDQGAAAAPQAPPAPSPAAARDEILPQTILASLENSKAEDVVAIDVAGKTTLADTMIIATGRSNVHVGAIADHLVKALRAAGFPTPRIEGVPHCDWVLLDAGDAIVHIFRPEVRQFYNLEKLWSAGRPGEAQTARAGCKKILPEYFFEHKESKEGTLRHQKEILQKVIPLITRSDIKSCPGTISFFALSKYRPNSFKFFFEMISRWLTPGRRLY